jgi:hypothetical protein
LAKADTAFQGASVGQPTESALGYFRPLASLSSAALDKKKRQPHGGELTPKVYLLLGGAKIDDEICKVLGVSLAIPCNFSESKNAWRLRLTAFKVDLIPLRSPFDS